MKKISKGVSLNGRQIVCLCKEWWVAHIPRGIWGMLPQESFYFYALKSILVHSETTTKTHIIYRDLATAS